MVGESKLRRPSFMRKCSLQGKLELANAVSQSECATSDEARRIQQALENQLAAATNRTQSGVSNDFARPNDPIAQHRHSAAGGQSARGGQRSARSPQPGGLRSHRGDDPHFSAANRSSMTARANTFRQSIVERVSHLSESGQHAAGHLRAHDIVHVNTNTEWLSFGHRVMYGHPVLVLLFALVFYVACTLLFAAMFWGFGPSCYSLGHGFDGRRRRARWAERW